MSPPLPTPANPELRAADLLSAVEALLPELPGPALLDLRDGLARIEGATLRRLLTAPPPRATVSEAGAILTLEEAAAHLRRSKSWLFHQWKRLGLGYRDGARVRFRRSRLDQYLRSCERKSR